MREIDTEAYNLLNFAIAIIENRLIGKLVVFLSEKYSLEEIANISSKATGRNFSKQRIFQLYEKYHLNSKKGGEKNMNKTIITAGILTLVFGAFVAKSALAYRGDPTKVGPNYDPVRHQQMLDAFAKKDYNTWKKLMGDRGIARKIDNQAEFNKFIEMRKLMLQGKTNEAAKIRAELGLGQGQGRGFGYNRK
jgi:hypothetical protein